VVQADQYVFGRTANNDFGKAIEFFFYDFASCVVLDAAVDANQEPVVDLFVCTIGKRWPATDRPHQVANVVIAGYTMGAELER